MRVITDPRSVGSYKVYTVYIAHCKSGRVPGTAVRANCLHCDAIQMLRDYRCSVLIRPLIQLAGYSQCQTAY